jgi:hypothetical protein
MGVANSVSGVALYTCSAIPMMVPPSTDCSAAQSPKLHISETSAHVPCLADGVCQTISPSSKGEICVPSIGGIRSLCPLEVE